MLHDDFYILQVWACNLSSNSHLQFLESCRVSFTFCPFPMNFMIMLQLPFHILPHSSLYFIMSAGSFLIAIQLLSTKAVRKILLRLGVISPTRSFSSELLT